VLNSKSFTKEIMLNILENVSKQKKVKKTVYSESGKGIGNNRHSIPANKE
jgi:hypothetical protein